MVLLDVSNYVMASVLCCIRRRSENRLFPTSGQKKFELGGPTVNMGYEKRQDTKAARCRRTKQGQEKKKSVEPDESYLKLSSEGRVYNNTELNLQYLPAEEPPSEYIFISIIAL